MLSHVMIDNSIRMKKLACKNKLAHNFMPAPDFDSFFINLFRDCLQFTPLTPRTQRPTSRKFATILLPCGVMIDSGWN